MKKIRQLHSIRSMIAVAIAGPFWAIFQNGSSQNLAEEILRTFGYVVVPGIAAWFASVLITWPFRSYFIAKDKSKRQLER